MFHFLRIVGLTFLTEFWIRTFLFYFFLGEIAIYTVIYIYIFHFFSDLLGFSPEPLQAAEKLRRAYRLKQTAELPEQLKETWNGQLEEINGDLSTEMGMGQYL